jgi:hypothetical protein
MITDRIELAGLEAYFQDPATGKVNLGGTTPAIRTLPLNKGKQVEISGIQLMIEHKDLQPLLSYPSDNADNPVSAPLFKISVMKEMFPGLFADPFSHRVHNIAGFLDFNEGSLTNGRVMEIEGIPTICSTGREECTWTSKEYSMPDPISIDAVAWELATSRLSPPDSFNYRLKITSKDTNGNALPDIDIDNGGSMLKADTKRAVNQLDNQNIKSFQILFTALVFEDAYFKERHLPTIDENIGRPLLRAVNILEPVRSVYEINSLTELQNLCSDFHLYESADLKIRRLTASLSLSATLVNGPNQDIVNNNNYDSATVYEYVELKLFKNGFTRFEAKRIADVLIRIN